MTGMKHGVKEKFLVPLKVKCRGKRKRSKNLVLELDVCYQVLDGSVFTVEHRHRRDHYLHLN